MVGQNITDVTQFIDIISLRTGKLMKVSEYCLFNLDQISFDNRPWMRRLEEYFEHLLCTQTQKHLKYIILKPKASTFH